MKIVKEQSLDLLFQPNSLVQPPPPSMCNPHTCSYAWKWDRKYWNITKHKPNGKKNMEKLYRDHRMVGLGIGENINIIFVSFSPFTLKIWTSTTSMRTRTLDPKTSPWKVSNFYDRNTYWENERK